MYSVVVRHKKLDSMTLSKYNFMTTRKARTFDLVNILIHSYGKKFLKITFPYSNITKVEILPNSPSPSPRTYHASCLAGKYMVTVGGEATADLKDFWALDLEQRMWYKPELEFQDYYTPKRFHTINAISET
jgi:hypothetical protein